MSQKNFWADRGSETMRPFLVAGKAHQLDRPIIGFEDSKELFYGKGYPHLLTQQLLA